MAVNNNAIGTRKNVTEEDFDLMNSILESVINAKELSKITELIDYYQGGIE